MQSSEEYPQFCEYVFEKMLDLGFRIFGGAVRNKYWKSVYEEDRIDTFGPQFYLKLWDAEYCRDTWYNRRGVIEDIDCIGTYEQFKSLTSLEMKKYGDLNYYVVEKVMKYPIPDISIEKGKLEMFKIVVSQKLGLNRSMINKYVYVDMFVCQESYLPQLYRTLSVGVDFKCNGLCMQRINGVTTTSLLYGDNLIAFLDAINDMKDDIAKLHRRSLDHTLFFRTMKMIQYGWFVEIFKIKDPFVMRGFDPERPNSVFIFSRSTHSSYCEICNQVRGFGPVGEYIYVMVNGLHFHLSCYLSKSIEMYERLHGSTFDPEEEPDVADTEEEHEPDDSNSEPEPNEPESDLEPEPIPLQEPPVVEEPDLIDRENMTLSERYQIRALEHLRSQTEELDRFIQFTRSQQQNLEDVVVPPTTSSIVRINGNVFVDGIAQENPELFNVQEVVDVVDNGDLLATHRTIERWCLCSGMSDVENLRLLKQLTDYFARVSFWSARI
jgi:hypothetical protein